jgi:hypothetical protein
MIVVLLSCLPESKVVISCLVRPRGREQGYLVVTVLSGETTSTLSLRVTGQLAL